MTDRHDTASVNTQFLYRLRDANGALLYVGVSNDWPTRMKQHQADKPWWSDVLAVELVRMDCSRRQLEAIEKAVIKAEAPIHNVVHNEARRMALPTRVDREAVVSAAIGDWSSVPPTELLFVVGEPVRHPTFGAGRILSVDHSCDTVEIWFFSHGNKYLSIDWAPLTRDNNVQWAP